MAKILIADDEANMRRVLSAIQKADEEGYGQVARQGRNRDAIQTFTVEQAAATSSSPSAYEHD